MKITQIVPMTLSALLLVAPVSLSADPSRDCLLTGTVHKSVQGGEEVVDVTFRSMERFNDDARCRVRKDEELEFKLPADPRLQGAPDGSAVEYRYREDSEGKSQTELIRVGNST